MKKTILFLLLISMTLAQNVVENKDTPTTTTTKNQDENSTANEVTTTAKVTGEPIKEEISTINVSPTSESNSVESSSQETLEETGGSFIEEEPQKPTSTQRRKILYINQQQSGKLNVHLELSDVNVIVIPNKRDPQTSLLNLLLRSAQKSNLKHEHKDKEEGAKVNVHHADDYSSKYKMDNYPHTSTNEPSIESRAPYRVDISSTLGQQPIDQQHNMQPQLPPLIKLLKPIPVTILPHTRMYKRSLDLRYLDVNPNILNDKSISSNDNDNNDEIELINSLENNEKYNSIDNQDIGSGTEFILLGATENCGPGRRRNSYQICVSVDE